MTDDRERGKGGCMLLSLAGDNWYPELPTIYPPLVIPAAHTRLAVPVSPLFHDQFEVDVLGLSGRVRRCAKTRKGAAESTYSGE